MLVWLIVILVIAILIIAGVIYFLLQKSDTTSDATGNANRTANTNVAVGTNTAISGTPLTNVDTGEQVWYRNPEFGYTLRYNDPGRSLVAALTSDTAANLYSQWTLSDSTAPIITVQVFPKDKSAEVFTQRQYVKTEATVGLPQFTANQLTVEGAKRGLTFEYGNYAFVLLASSAEGTGGYTQFDTIAKTLTF